MRIEIRTHLIERIRRDTAAVRDAKVSTVAELLADRRAAAAVEVSRTARVRPSRPG
ncbi:hypothetical protein ACOQFL_04280 [Actinopolyspora sp. H202]|uniref:hypothetical protein n=1 Tax=Actinopolyspora sp. H202 TaxID=1500456 RepID=UPI003EE7DB18